MARVPGCEAVYEVANQWRERCLERDGSLLWPDIEEPTWSQSNLQWVKSRIAQFRSEAFTDFGQLEELKLVAGPQNARLLVDLSALWSLFRSYKPASSSRIEDVLTIPSLDPPDESVMADLKTAQESAVAASINLAVNPGALRSELLFMIQLTFDAKRKVPNPITENAWATFAEYVLDDYPDATNAFVQFVHLMFPERIEPVNSIQISQIANAFTPPDEQVRTVSTALIYARIQAEKLVNRKDVSFFDEDVRLIWDTTRTPGGSSSFWWVNQGASFQNEHDGGFIFAPGFSVAGASLRHHQLLKAMSRNDLIIHYSGGAVRSMGKVLSPVPDDKERDFRVEVEYFDLDEPIGITEFPESLRTPSIGPFDRGGGVKQQYLHPLSSEWFRRFCRQFEGRLPAHFEECASRETSASLDELAHRLCWTLESTQTLNELLLHKRQLVFEGSPGTGKTYIARLFARYLAGLPLNGERDPQVEIVQFHQSYGYEDFVAGIRPSATSEGTIRYDVQPGIFFEMCQRAEEYPDRNYVLIIDEINRGNVSRIFGELLYALEYRDEPVRMQYPALLGDVDADHLVIPSNLYLIGTMNSTDRSLAMIDYALRRRFYFWKLAPVVEGRAPFLEGWLRSKSFEPAAVENITRRFVEINVQISSYLTPDYAIGHSYFMDEEIGQSAGRARIWTYQLQPLLEEYFHNRRDRDDAIATLRDIMLGS